MKREVRDFLNDILLYAEKAEEIVAQNSSTNLTQFSTEGMALMLCIQIIGEAVKNIPEDIRVKSSEIPWREIAGMRDRLTHNYWNTSMPKSSRYSLEPFASVANQYSKDFRRFSVICPK